MAIRSCIYGLPGIRYRRRHPLAAIEAVEESGPIDVCRIEGGTVSLSNGNCVTAEIEFPHRGAALAWPWTYSIRRLVDAAAQSGFARKGD